MIKTPTLESVVEVAEVAEGHVVPTQDPTQEVVAEVAEIAELDLVDMIKLKKD
ncbi:MAG: hypothetical protein JSV92_03025 [archaeon]|nr:MAG: hypothetical protein JSV92_03025 [archaeon]